MRQLDWSDPAENDEGGVELNLTPLVDVVLVLLIIFMVSSAVVTDQNKTENANSVVDLSLPTGAAPSNAAPQAEVIVQINADGSLFEAGGATDRKTLAKSLVERIATQPDVQVRIEADKSLSYEKVMDLIVELQALGVHNIGMGYKGAPK